MPDVIIETVPARISDVANRLYSVAQSAMSREMARAHARIADLVVVAAKDYAPISPTKAQYISTLKGRRVKGGRIVKKTKRNDFHPGQLTAAIRGESAEQFARIFVPSNSRAGVYADFIHNGTYKRGVGTVAKGSQARRKFIERAIKDNMALIESRYIDAIAAVVGEMNNA